MCLFGKGSRHLPKQVLNHVLESDLCRKHPFSIMCGFLQMWSIVWQILTTTYYMMFHFNEMEQGFGPFDVRKAKCSDFPLIYGHAMLFVELCSLPVSK